MRATLDAPPVPSPDWSIVAKLTEAGSRIVATFHVPLCVMLASLKPIAPPCEIVALLFEAC